MSDYIEREAAIEEAKKSHLYFDLKPIINSLPAADVRPVVRGRWEDAMQSCHDSPHVKCSVCGEYYWRYFNKFNFCPNCGAKMEG